MGSYKEEIKKERERRKKKQKREKEIKWLCCNLVDFLFLIIIKKNVYVTTQIRAVV